MAEQALLQPRGRSTQALQQAGKQSGRQVEAETPVEDALFSDYSTFSFLIASVWYAFAQ